MKHEIVRGGGISRRMQISPNYSMEVKKQGSKLLSISLLNVDRFSKFFQQHVLRKICNKIVMKNPTTP